MASSPQVLFTDSFKLVTNNEKRALIERNPERLSLAPQEVVTIYNNLLRDV
jgi:hypothetical protein